MYGLVAGVIEELICNNVIVFAISVDESVIQFVQRRNQEHT